MLAHFQHVSLTFQHACLVWMIFSPISVLTFRPTGVFVEHALGNQRHAHSCAICAVDALFWAKGDEVTIQSFGLERICESKLLVAHSWATVPHLLRLTSERQSAVTLFVTTLWDDDWGNGVHHTQNVYTRCVTDANCSKM